MRARLLASFGSALVAPLFIACAPSGAAPSDGVDRFELEQTNTWSCIRGVDDVHSTYPERPESSQLFARIVEAASKDADRGTVCREHFVTSRNAADLKLYRDGPEIFPRMAELIAAARSDIALQTYVWENWSESAATIVRGFDDLYAALQADPPAQPVRLRMLLDVSDIGVGSKSAYVDELVETLEQRAFDPDLVAWEVGGYHHKLLGNLHVKTLVVDGTKSLVAGANPQEHHDEPAPWRDAGFVVEGEAARGLLSDFDHAWTDDPARVHGRNGAAVDKWAVDHEVRSLPESDVQLPVMIATRRRDWNPFGNRTDNPQDRAFMAAFDHAQLLIRVQTPNLNDDAAKKKLLSAARRGVAVQLVLAKGFNESSEDKPGQGNGNSTNVRQLYQALFSEYGAGTLLHHPCDVLQVRWHSSDGVTNICGNGDHATHAKYASVDESVAIVGTANMDTQSWNNSREVNLVVDDAATTISWDTAMFMEDFARGIAAKECASPDDAPETACPGEDDAE
jgi:phosphatidylserine/phosphatidylglycerophosphate/cardiolipin synthase-like enzyme